jgi:hypothetical protein
VLALSWSQEVPEWARKELFEAYFHNRPKSWDEVFGTPFPKDTKVASLQKLNLIKGKVFRRIKELHARGRPIGDELFEQVGKEFAVSAQPIRDSIYYDKGLHAANALLEWALARRDDGIVSLHEKRNLDRANKLLNESISQGISKRSKKRP